MRGLGIHVALGLLVACSSPTIDGSGNLFFASPPTIVGLDEDVTVALEARDHAQQVIAGYSGSVHFFSSDGSAQLPAPYQFVEDDHGRHEFVITFKTAGVHTLSAKDDRRGWVATQSIEVKELTYTDPPAGTGKIRLVRDAASPGLVLKLVAAVDLKGYAVGFDLPLQQPVLTTSTELLTPGDALRLGQAPLAIGAAVGVKGPLTGVLATGVSQKAGGAGAVTDETEIKAGQAFYSFRLKPTGARSPGVIFDGASPGTKFRAALRNRMGEDVVSSGDFAIGRLELR